MISDINTERLVMGTILSYPKLLPEAREYLSPDCFTDPKLREMYAIVTELADKGEPVNVLTVTAALQTHDTHLVPTDIIDVSMNVCFSDLSYEVRVLYELNIRRRLGLIGQEFINASESLADPLDELLNSARDRIAGVYRESSGGIRKLKDVVSEVKDIIDHNLKGEKVSGTPTGFSVIDEDGGLHESDLVVIAGATSQGKTSFALSLTLNASCLGSRVAYYSLEMTNRQLSARMIAMKSNVPSKDILYSPLPQDSLHKVEQGINNLPLDNMFFDDKSTNNIDSIIASIRVMKIKHGIDGAVIDYLQILSVTTRRDGNNEQFLGEVARRLKNLAKELGIWVVILSQLRRDPDNPVPDINKLRGSGQIAEAADMVILVYRPETYNKRYPKPYEDRETHNTAMIDIAKSRNIGTKKFLCTFIPEITMFTDKDAAVAKSDEDMPF